MSEQRDHSDDTRPVNQPAQPTNQPPNQPAYAAPAPRSGRGGLLLAGLALGIALVAGTGGFALGHVMADDGREGPERMFRQGSGEGPDGQDGPFGQFRMQPPGR